MYASTNSALPGLCQSEPHLRTVSISLTISPHLPCTAGAVIPDASAPRFGASVDREVLMPQESFGQYVGQFIGEYLGEDLVHAETITPPYPQALTPHEIVPMLIGSTVEAIERELVLQTLARCEGNRTHAARVLGLSVRTMRNKIKQYATDGVDIPAHS